jgi:hypothetical protein
MEAEPMRVLQFAKRSVVTVALVSLSLSGCSGDGGPDAPFNAAGTSADLQAMNTTFASSSFASFSTFGVMFDAALGGSPIISSSVAALDVRGKDAAGVRAAVLQPHSAASLQSGRVAAAVPAEVAGKTFVFDLASNSYVMSELTGAPVNGVRFILYKVDEASYAPLDPLEEIGYADLIDLSGGSTQAARVLVVANGTTYVDYTVTATSNTSSGRVTVVGMITDGNNQANITLRSTITFSAGLTLTYALDLPQRDVSIELSVGSNDLSQDSPITVSLTMSGPNGTVSMSGQFNDTSGTLNVRINGHAFATLTATGSSVTITRVDGSPLTDDEVAALEGVFLIQNAAFVAFDQMLAPIGAMFEQPA